MTKDQYTPRRGTRTFTEMCELTSHGFFLTPLLQPGFDVLDAGCGAGAISADIAEHVFPGRVTAMDASPHLLERGQRLSQGREIMNIDFIAAEAGALPFPDATFDVVFSHGLLEDLEDPEAAVHEFHRVTRPGGFVAISSLDWNDIEISPLPMRVGRAIMAYRHILEQHGADTRAGAHLGQWLAEAGFTLLAQDSWTEEYEDTVHVADYIASQLDNAGQMHHATSLRDWARQEGSTLRQTWKYVTAVRADAARPRRIILE